MAEPGRDERGSAHTGGLSRRSLIAFLVVGGVAARRGWWRSAMAATAPVGSPPVTVARPGRLSAGPSFVDPTVTRYGHDHIHLGPGVYVAPFARLLAAGPGRDIHVGSHSDVQDNVDVDALRGAVWIGDRVALAHGCTVKNGAVIGGTGPTPEPAFVGFNAEVDGATVEPDAMVLHLARVGPGVRVPAGRKVMPGRNVVSQSQVMDKSAAVTEADRLFMEGVIEVNVALAHGYAALAAESPSNVRGVNYDPGDNPFNPGRDLPTVSGQPVRDPNARGRVIGDVRLADGLSLRRVVLSSLRADEGEPFVVGTISSLGTHSTFHSLEHAGLDLGDRGTYGPRSLVHGGPAFDGVTRTGPGLRLGAGSVLFQSHTGTGVTIGARSLVQATTLADGAAVPARTVMIGGHVVGAVEW